MKHIEHVRETNTARVGAAIDGEPTGRSRWLPASATLDAIRAQVQLKSHSPVVGVLDECTHIRDLDISSFDLVEIVMSLEHEFDVEMDLVVLDSIGLTLGRMHAALRTAMAGVTAR